MHALSRLALAATLAGSALGAGGAHATDPPEPSAPTTVTVSAPALDAVVSWQPPMSGELTGYRVDAVLRWCALRNEIVSLTVKAEI